MILCFFNSGLFSYFISCVSLIDQGLKASIRLSCLFRSSRQARGKGRWLLFEDCYRNL